MAQQPFLPNRTGGEPPKPTARCDDTVAWNDDGDRIAAAGLADRLGLIPTPRPTQPRGRRWDREGAGRHARASEAVRLQWAGLIGP